MPTCPAQPPALDAASDAAHDPSTDPHLDTDHHAHACALPSRATPRHRTARAHAPCLKQGRLPAAASHLILSHTLRSPPHPHRPVRFLYYPNQSSALRRRPLAVRFDLQHHEGRTHAPQMYDRTSIQSTQARGSSLDLSMRRCRSFHEDDQEEDDDDELAPLHSPLAIRVMQASAQTDYFGTSWSTRLQAGHVVGLEPTRLQPLASSHHPIPPLTVQLDRTERCTPTPRPSGRLSAPALLGPVHPPPLDDEDDPTPVPSPSAAAAAASSFPGGYFTSACLPLHTACPLGPDLRTLTLTHPHPHDHEYAPDYVYDHDRMLDDLRSSPSSASGSRSSSFSTCTSEPSSLDGVDPPPAPQLSPPVPAHAHTGKPAPWAFPPASPTDPHAHNLSRPPSSPPSAPRTKYKKKRTKRRSSAPPPLVAFGDDGEGALGGF